MNYEHRVEYIIYNINLGLSDMCQSLNFIPGPFHLITMEAQIGQPLGFTTENI